MTPRELLARLISFDEDALNKAYGIALTVYKALGLPEDKISDSVMYSILETDVNVCELSDFIVDEYLSTAEYTIDTELEREYPDLGTVVYALSPLSTIANGECIQLRYNDVPIETEQDVQDALKAYRDNVQEYILLSNIRFMDLYQELNAKLSKVSIELPGDMPPLDDEWYFKLPEKEATKYHLIDIAAQNIRNYCEESNLLVRHNPVDRHTIVNHLDALIREIKEAERCQGCDKER